MDWQDRIVIGPEILVGKPVIKGARLAVEFIIELLSQRCPNRKSLRIILVCSEGTCYLWDSN
jgi:uncharacterized protein (DUF433 family)